MTRTLKLKGRWFLVKYLILRLLIATYNHQRASENEIIKIPKLKTKKIKIPLKIWMTQEKIKIPHKIWMAQGQGVAAALVWLQASVDVDEASRSSLKTPPLPKIAEVVEAASELARWVVAPCLCSSVAWEAAQNYAWTGSIHLSLYLFGRNVCSLAC